MSEAAAAGVLSPGSTRGRALFVAAVVVLILLLLWGSSGRSPPPSSSQPPEIPASAEGGRAAEEPTWSLAELPSVAPEPPPPEGPGGSARGDASPEVRDPGGSLPGSTPQPPQADDAERRRPLLRPLPGALGGTGASRPRKARSALMEHMRAEEIRPEQVYEALDKASPEQLHAYLEDATAQARPEHRYLFSVPPEAVREQLVHTALLNEAIERRRSLEARFGKRIPLDAAVILADLNLAVARRGLNSPVAQGEIEDDLLRVLGQDPGKAEFDRVFFAAQTALARLTRSGPPPEDPQALALAQASAYYRVMTMAAVRLELSTGHHVPGVPPRFSAKDPQAERPPVGGLKGGLENR